MSNGTLSNLERRWPVFDLDSLALPHVRSSGQLTVGQSRSGAGMVLLKGLEVKVGEKWVSAHLSFPPDSTGLGTFAEGHLKIEEGAYLNQYFFSCDANATWEVEKLANSPTVKTQNPGNWAVLGGALWLDIDKLVTLLAYR